MKIRRTIGRGLRGLAEWVDGQAKREARRDARLSRATMTATAMGDQALAELDKMILIGGTDRMWRLYRAAHDGQFFVPGDDDAAMILQALVMTGISQHIHRERVRREVACA